MDQMKDERAARRFQARPLARWLAFLIFAVAALTAGPAYAGLAAKASEVPVIDGEAGPCSVEFTVKDAADAPVYDAKVRVHIAYGFMYLRKLDLEVGTNKDGKARFTGLPDRVKDGLLFHASQADREGSAFVDPAQTCKSEHSIVLEKKSETSSN